MSIARRPPKRYESSAHAYRVLILSGPLVAFASLPRSYDPKMEGASLVNCHGLVTDKDKNIYLT